MFQKISRHDFALAFFAGLSIVLAFIPFHVVPLIFLFPVFLNLLSLRRPGFRSAFAYAFLTSFVVNAGGFYWVTYTIHEFGYLPWAVSALLFLVFCGFGALNFPLFAASAAWIHYRVELKKCSPAFVAVWFTVGLPALFTLPEYFVPKLFPFYSGHCFYWLPLFTQISEIPGLIVLSFLVYSVGGLPTLWWLKKKEGWRFHPLAALIPGAFALIWVAFGYARLATAPPSGKTLRVALIQPNIGSLEKVEARRGVMGKVRLVMDRYKQLTDRAIASTPPPQLIVWPETAMPFQLESPRMFAQELRESIGKWKIPLLTGAYAPHETDPTRDYNAAYLLVPDGNRLHTQVYKKNILLAFGEYFPGGDTFPDVYQYFPQVSNFGRGTEQTPFTFPDGMRIGVTICYEAIVPDFYLKIVRQKVNAVVNLTNDSWFGPTTEPYHHGALAVFRTVETRVPLIRVTNTGVSFTVDTYGRMSEMTGVYKEGVLVSDVWLPETPPETFYTRWGDWFIMVCIAMVALLAFILFRKPHAALPV